MSPGRNDDHPLADRDAQPFSARRRVDRHEVTRALDVFANGWNAGSTWQS
jgi:hypothetical protein